MNRRTHGTTLIEILVVIVVFLVGILAVVQIFPKGFQILNLNRTASQATFLARDTMAAIEARPDTFPDQIVPVDPDTGATDAAIPAESVGLNAIGISSTGVVTTPGGNSKDPAGNYLSWTQTLGFNEVRRIVGEGQPVPAPRLIGTNNAYYGGLVVLQYGPISVYTDNNGIPTNLVAYANDLTKTLVGSDPNSATNPLQAADYQYFVYYVPNGTTSATPVPSLYLTEGAELAGRIYQISFAGYINQAGVGIQKRNFSVQVKVPTGTLSAGASTYPMAKYDLAGVASGLTGVDTDSIRVQRVYRIIPNSQAFAGQNKTPIDPFEVKLLNPSLGVLLFNPGGYNYEIARPTGAREALRARVTYDVRDWRILHDDFRIDGDGPGIHQLPIQSLRTASQTNVDGTPGNAGSNGFGFENASSDVNGVDHFILMDLLTGGTYVESGLITVDKSRGLVNFAAPIGNLLLPDGTTMTGISLANRPVRALYQARIEMAVQVLKSASTYSVSFGTPGVGQYYVGGTNSSLGGSYTRIYFPPCDANRKVTIGTIWYKQSGNTQEHSLRGQDFIIHPAQPNSQPSLPYIDIQEADSTAASLDFATYGYAARDVKGASLMVRVVWNPNTFALKSDPAANVQSEATWGQGWRKAATETFLDQGVTSK